MSKSLVRKSLELLDSETDSSKDKKRKRNKSSGALDLIPVNQRILAKTKKRGCHSVLKRTSKLTVDEVKKQLALKADPTDENVQRLLSLSKHALDSETTEKILMRAVEKHYVIKKEKPVEEEKTVFNEEDFQKFEAEYTG
ncbi:active regulator of SIRT1-like [Phymastichus coffea]|uniref:active regulator of SIRT1-like n=1 Tax=Phymastichus coffea TaxID=108790 RepID=UPI00273AA01C|nr:active regulator of SIRT1-like [Phymastichus coffea]